MKKYIFMERNGIHIIDLKKTLALLQRACQEMTRIVREGEQVLFVGTKKQAKEIIQTEAERCGQFYVVERWLGGTLTNFVTIRRSIKRLKNLEKMATDGTYDKLTKKEILRLEREKAKLEEVLGGIRDMTRLPGALYVVDVKKELIAVNEARRLGIPVFAIVDTNADPDLVDYPIPGNDDAFKSINIITHAIAEAVIEGLEGRTEVPEVAVEEEEEDRRKYAVEGVEEEEMYYPEKE
jgi:small subunit ribosomal protein S2